MHVGHSAALRELLLVLRGIGVDPSECSFRFDPPIPDENLWLTGNTGDGTVLVSLAFDSVGDLTGPALTSYVKDLADSGPCIVVLAYANVECETYRTVRSHLAAGGRWRWSEPSGDYAAVLRSIGLEVIHDAPVPFREGDVTDLLRALPLDLCTTPVVSPTEGPMRLLIGAANLTGRVRCPGRVRRPVVARTPPPPPARAPNAHEALSAGWRADSDAWTAAHLVEAKRYASRWEMLSDLLALAPDRGDLMEFGVAAGQSIAHLTAEFSRLNKRGSLYGFDSFHGLPEEWRDVGGMVPAGHFSTNGVVPNVPGVRFIPGLYRDSLPRFAADYTGRIAFAHVDCDLYSSTKEVLRFLKGRLLPGAIVVFDELIGYPDWQKHELKALSEEGVGQMYRFIGYVDGSNPVAIRLTGWKDTTEAPPRAWAWSASDGPMYEEERAACVAVDRILRARDGVGLRGRTVLELGCGRGACLRYARDHLSAGPLVGVDRAAGAIEAATAALADLPDVRIVQAEAVATGLPDGCADVVWSHGVVEHFRPDELAAYVREALRLAGSGYVAFSAPNPVAPAYAAFRRILLAEERWEWGYEEPLASYAPVVVAAGGEVLFDGSVGMKFKHAHPYARLLPEAEQDAVRERCAARTEPGIYTLVIARAQARG